MQDTGDGYELILLDEDNNTAKWARRKMEKTVQSHNGIQGGGYRNFKVYQVRNSHLWGKYCERRDVIKNEINGMVKEVRLFHGTSFAYDIVKDGFRVELAIDNGMFGKAIYFSDISSKSNQYTFGGCNAPCLRHHEVFCGICERTMLICRVALGKEYEATVAMNSLTQPPNGYHSVVANPRPGFLHYREYSIYDNFQVYPGFLVKYTILEPLQTPLLPLLPPFGLLSFSQSLAMKLVTNLRDASRP